MLENPKVRQIHSCFDINLVSVSGREKGLNQMRGSAHGFGAGASPPMQLTLGHSALKLCKIGDLRCYVGQ